MIKPILGTVSTRVIVTLLNLLVVMATGKLLGTEGLGSVSLIVLGITFILLLSNVIGGSAVTYLAPRYTLVRLLVPSYIWAFATGSIAYLVMHYLPGAHAGMAQHIAILALLHSVVAIHLALVLGRKKIGWQNGMQILQAGLLLCFYWIFLKQADAIVMDYILAAYCSLGLTAAVSGFLLTRTKGPATNDPIPVWKALFKQGGLAQSANLMQFINYRFTFFLIQSLKGLSAFGIFSVAVQLAESAWLAPKSLGTVLYAEISNTKDPDRQQNMTLTILKTALSLSAAVILGLLLLPSTVYQWFFGEEVVGMHPIILIMSPGLIAMAASQAFSHYFSGTGQNQFNVAGSGIAMVLTLATGYFLVLNFGLWGAAATASLAYCSSALYQAIIFSKLTGAGIAAYLPTKGDLERIKGIWYKLRT